MPAARLFSKAQKTRGGIYLIVYPAKTNISEVLVDKQQRFFVIADTATIRTRKTFVNSPIMTCLPITRDLWAPVDVNSMVTGKAWPPRRTIPTRRTGTGNPPG